MTRRHVGARSTSVGRALLLALALAASAAACGQPGAIATPVVVKDFALDPTDVVVGATGATLAVTNQGPTVHNVAVRDDGGSVVVTTRDLREGESQDLALSLAAGRYALICTLPGHESLGIKGTLTVR
jgi:plastocyanin